ncbi:MAG: hypothetical protein F4X94_08055 [Dehalococcoidia bacterium]|nr:hypothetical protein [Dehalococcoidia bacterium]
MPQVNEFLSLTSRLENMEEMGAARETAEARAQPAEAADEMERVARKTAEARNAELRRLGAR